MKKISCLIVDDEPLARKGIEEYIREIDFLELKAVTGSSLEAASLISKHEIALLFLDIEMPVLSGIELLKTLKYPPAVILTTAYPDYALEGFDLDVVDYLLKPFAFPRFVKAVNKAADFIQSGKETSQEVEKEYFFIKVNSRFEKVLYSEVLFIEALQNYIAIHMAGKKMLSYMPISALEKQLPPKLFMRTHKSYIISLSKINAIEGNQVIILQHHLPLSRRVKDQLQKRLFENNLLKR